MQLKYFLAASAASLSMAVGLAAPAHAQEITSGIEGRVLDENGGSVQGATVVVTDTRTGSSRTLSSQNDGSFRADSLVTGGPYTVTATAPGFEGQTVQDINISLSGNTSLRFELSSGANDDVIVVTAARANLTQLAVGPGQSFGLETLEGFPSITRDIRDIIRIDPRVSLERDNEVDRISCLGGNDRSNTFSVDGIVQADSFGLNGTPFAARNALPIPFDAVRETSVEFAPFDVEYGSFTGCSINVVTKSGENEFHGSAYFAYRNEDLRGDTAGGDTFIPASFEEKRWGATLSGPIIKDRLFFFAAYEETDLGGSNDFGPVGAGFANEAEFATQADFDEFSSILSSVYGRESGGYPRSTPEASVRYFGRVDAYLTENQRLEATYQRLEETNVELDVGGDELQGFNSFEDEGTISDYYSLRLYSDWTDNFSTEVRISRAEVGDVQGPVGGGEAQSANPRPRLVVGVTNAAGDTGIISDGPGIFRSANQLDTRIDQFKFAANLQAGDHRLTVGTEINDLRVFNLFAINATGSLYFTNLDDFRNGILSTGTEFFPNADEIARGLAYGADINASPTGDINEASATFSRTIYTFYAQDEWQVNDKLNLLFGARVDIYNGDAPRANPNFFNRYGFTNSTSFGKLDPVFLPRAAFTYDLFNDGLFSNTSVKGGVGIFAGGDPTVWFSNAFSNNGFSTALGTSLDCAVTPTNVVVGGSFTGFPDCVRQAGSADAAAGLADTQSTDPNIKTPTVVRANIGVSTNFGTDTGFFSNWRLNVDYIYSHFRNPFNFVDLSQIPDPSRGLNGFTVDGRPILRPIDPTAAGCSAQLIGTGGTPPQYTNVSAACFNTRRDDEIQLTNSKGYDSHVASILLGKRFDGGIFTDGGSVNFNLGYAFTSADERRTNDNSTATSGFDRTAAFDRQEPGVRTSSFASKHNFSAAFSVREQFFGDFDTRVGFVFIARSGRPYSYTFDGGGVFADSSSGNDNALLYVPTGLTDANVIYRDTTRRDDMGNTIVVQTAAEAQTGLDNYINGDKCLNKFRGRTIAANSCTNDWSFDLDLRFSQEIPGPGRLFGVEDTIELFMDVDNALNLIDGEWNESRSRQNLVDLIDGGVDSQGRYVLNDFNPDDDNDVRVSSSIWRVQVGVRYEF